MVLLAEIEHTKGGTDILGEKNDLSLDMLSVEFKKWISFLGGDF